MIPENPDANEMAVDADVIDRKACGEITRIVS
ncbi:hypothetical protein ABIE69_001788 [Rhodobacteraceae bacterium MBR-64]